MRKRNRGAVLLLALFLTLGGAWPAYAAEPETPPPPATEEGGPPEPADPAPGSEETLEPEPAFSAVVTGFAGDGLPTLPAFALPVRQTGNSDDDLEQIYELAFRHQSVTALVTVGDETQQESLGVAWDFSGIDQTKAGTYQAVGSIELPEGYALADGVPGALYIPVTVEELPPEVITAVEPWYPYTDAVALPLGSSLEEIEEKFSFSPYTLQCDTEGGKTVTATVAWDFSGVDLSTAGVYTALGTVIPPENAVFAEGVTLPKVSIPISVQRPGRPELDCFLVARGKLVFPWVTPPGDLAGISVWLSEDRGPWELVSEMAYWDEYQLALSTTLLKEGSSYRLQADYDGGRTGILSFIYADEIVLEGYHDGDRDGGDSDGNPPADIVQPPPTIDETEPEQPDVESSDTKIDSEPEQSKPKPPRPPAPSEPKPRPTPEPAEPEESPESIPPAPTQDTKPFPEQVTDTYSLLSGARVLMMRESGPVRFSKQGVTLTLSDAALDGLGLNADSQFYIEITRTGDGFSLVMEVDGKPVEALPDTTVLLPYTPSADGSILTLMDAGGTTVCEGTYTAAQAVAAFSIGSLGWYTVAEVVPANSAEQLKLEEDTQPPAEELTQASDKVPNPSETPEPQPEDMKAPDTPPVGEDAAPELDSTPEAVETAPPFTEGQTPTERGAHTLLFLLPAFLAALAAAALLLWRRWRR